MTTLELVERHLENCGYVVSMADHQYRQIKPSELDDYHTHWMLIKDNHIHIGPICSYHAKYSITIDIADPDAFDKLTNYIRTINPVNLDN